ncbi:MAG TPA: DUF3300 domain-containing protein, partial [Opitutales bacterium]|nr:DUF3300 domain-containing protein [Opitutales bacterium]
FYVNGTRFFVKGSNWIPEAMCRTSFERTRAELLYTRQSGINFLRFWGGGITESDAFFDLCDELGILIWTEFWQSGDTIIAEDQVIRIVPNDPEVVYIPTYDTRVVYVDRYVGVPSIEYATWFGIGSWLCFDLDWASWNVRVVKPHWRTHWYQSRPWHRPDFHRRDPFWSHRDRFRDWTPPRKPHPRSFRDHNPPKWNNNPGRNDYHPSPNPSKRPSFSRPVAPRHDSFRKPEAWHSPSRHSSGNLKPDRRPDRDHRPTPRLNKEPKSGYTSPSNHIPDRSFRKRDHNPPKDHGKIHPRPSFESKRPPTPKASRFNNKAPRQPAIGIRPPSGSPHPSNRYPGKGTPSQGNGPGKKHDR